LNPDTVLEAGCLARLLEHVALGTVANPKIVLLEEPEKLNTCGNLLHFLGFGFTNGYQAGRDTFSAECELPGISGAAFAIRREDFDSIGGFDEDFFLYMEDTDLSWRLRKAGMALRLVPDAVVRHSYSLEMGVRQYYFLEFGRTLLLRKHCRWWVLLLMLPALLLGEVLSLSWATRFGAEGLRARLRAFVDAVRMPLTRSSTCTTVGFLGHSIPFARLTESRLIRSLSVPVNALLYLNYLLVRNIDGQP